MCVRGRQPSQELGFPTMMMRNRLVASQLSIRSAYSMIGVLQPVQTFDGHESKSQAARELTIKSAGKMTGTKTVHTMHNIQNRKVRTPLNQFIY